MDFLMGKGKTMMQSLKWRVSTPVVVGMVLLGCGGAGQTQPTVIGPAVQTWVTLTDQSKLLSLEAGKNFTNKQSTLPLNIAVDPLQRYQEIVGFGANISDASAWPPSGSSCMNSSRPWISSG